MVAGYLSTDIIVIIVLIVVLVILGIGAFFIHFYWTKIGVSEIWNTTKWSSMRSSFYRTIGRFSRRSESKLGSERALSNASFYSGGIDDISYEKPKITSYVTPVNNPVQKPVSVNHPVQTTKISSINESNDLASRIRKQRF